MNINIINPIHSSILTDEQIKDIHRATLDILAETGIRVDHPEAKRLLIENGAIQDDNDIIKIPGRMVEDAIESAPDSIQIFDRDGSPFIDLSKDRIYYGSNAEELMLKDPFTGKTRDIQPEDRKFLNTLIDALPNISFSMTCGLCKKESPSLGDRLSFSTAVKYCRKPIVMTCISDAKACSDIIEAAEAVAGGPGELEAKPFLINFSEPVSPLYDSGQSIDNLLYCAEKNIPNIFMPAYLSGGTAPATMMGSLIQSNAEILSGLVLSQLQRKGSRFIYGALGCIMDMKTTIGTYGSPETHILVNAGTELANYYNLPFYGTSGTSDAFHEDEQAVAEMTMSMMTAALTRNNGNISHDIALLYHGTILSPRLLVAADEIINMLKPFRRGVAPGEKEMAVDIIKKVGPGGSFLKEKHTARNCRGIWYPAMFDRSMTGGEKPMGEKIMDRLTDIRDNHRAPELDPEKLKKLEAIENKWNETF